MNTFLKNFGIILIVLGVAVLSFYVMNNPTSNAPLAFAALLLIGGLSVHIILNRIID
jgi:multisubunit Na+/H+ antiporter MnhG subunit